MQDAKNYTAYAADCRRIAETMIGKDKETLLRMAELWDEQAKEALRREGKPQVRAEPRSEA